MRFKVDFSQWAGSIFRRRGAKLINVRMNFIVLTATSPTSKLFAESSLVRLFSQCERHFGNPWKFKICTVHLSLLLILIDPIVR